MEYRYYFCCQFVQLLGCGGKRIQRAGVPGLTVEVAFIGLNGVIQPLA